MADIKKLEKIFDQEQVLHSAEMNDITAKIDEIIGRVNSASSITGYSYLVTINVDGARNGYLYYKRSDARALLTATATTTIIYNADGSRVELEGVEYNASVEVQDANGNYVMVANNISVEGDTLSLDIKAYLSTTARKVRITFVAVASSASRQVEVSAMLTTMSLTPANVLWENAYVDNPNGYSFGAFAITGNLDKTVYLRVSNTELGYDHTSSVNIGTTTFANGGYYFVLTDFPTTGTEVYKFEIWVASGTLESTHYTYNVMCVASSQAATAQLVCINNVGTQVVNGTSARLFDYAIYNGGNSTSGSSTTNNVRQTISAWYSGVSHPIYDALLSNVAASQKNSLYFNVDLNAQSPTLIAMLTYGDTHPSASFLVDMSASFPATNGAVFYMNPSTRSNAQADRDVIKNASDSTDVQAVWTKMAFVDGMDGWTVDDNGRSCLAINAGSKCQINYAPLNVTSNYIAIEINYKTSVVSNYKENVITIASMPQDNPDNFTGIRIRPDEVCVHSSQRKSTFDNVQSYHTGDEDDIDLIIVFSQDYKNWKKRFCHIFVNGTIKCEFALEGNDNFITSAPIILGSDSANLYVYGIRVYNQAFGFLAATTNYVASLPTIEEKRAANARENDVMNEDGDVSYEKVIQSTTANWFIVEMIYKEDADGKAIKPWVKPTIPSYSDWTKKEVGRANLEMHFGAHPTWDWKINDVEHMGQGTTSMNYYRWNFRDRIDKTTTEVGTTKYEKQVYVQYGYNRSTGTWGNAALSKTVKFDGDTHSPVMRITAKKNYASSQQSHKMGTTSAYNDLHDICVDVNEGGGRTAVFQYPAYGFVRTYDDLGNEKYEFIGLFTIGPDKGDKPTFKYNAKINNVELKKTLMTMEGLDHDKRLAVFRYPWNNDVVFNSESLSIRINNDEYEAGWEVGNCYDYDTEEDGTEIMAKLVEEFKPAYELAYLNSPFIMGLTTSRFGVQTVAAALTKINSDVTGFGSTPNEDDDDRPYLYYEFYFEGDYNLYYLDIKDNTYKASGVNVLENLNMTTTSSLNANILKKLGLSTYGVFGDFNTDTQKNQYLSLKGVETMGSEDELDAAILSTMGLLSISTIEDLALVKKDEYLREMRRRRFRTAMLASDSPWNLNDTLFCHTFLVMFGATDNHAKNSYPYKFKSLSDGGKWRWRQDDLDTIFDIDNQGNSAKKYSIEFKDWTSSDKVARVFKGEDSAFWTLVDQCFEDEIRKMGRNILDAMISLGGSSEGGVFDKLMAFFKEYYWDKAQNYFSKGAYNHDARYSYEDAYYATLQGQYNVDVLPTAQSHGDSLESEMYWVERRLVYCMSKFRYGPFASYTDVSLGRIAFRTQNPQRFSLTPAMDLYPCVFSGQGVRYFSRTWDGEVGTMDGIGGNNTTVYIMAADYFRSIGDLAAFDIDRSSATNLQISSKRLETLKIGDEDATKVSNGVAMLTFSNCPSLTMIDARNATNLSGSLDLSNCPRIRTVYLTGTQVAGLTFAEGSKLETLTLPSTMTALSLKNLKFLSSLDVAACAPNVKSVDIEGCTMLQSFQILKDIYYSNDTQGKNALTYIRITDIDETVTSAEDPNGQVAEMLYRIAKGLDADANEKNYYALDAQGRETSDTAYISGTIRFETLMTGYASAIQAYFPYLTIEVGQQITPSEQAIGLTLSGERNETIYEDEAVGITRTYEVGANTIAYKSVKWSSESIPAAIAFRTTDYTATLDFANFVPSGSSNGNTDNFKVIATSTWNNTVRVIREIALARIPILSITLNLDKEVIDFDDNTHCTITRTFNPVVNTKERLVEYVYDSSVIEIRGNDVYPVTSEYTFTDVYARLSDNHNLVSNTKRIYLNDLRIIDATIETGFAALLNYIYTSLKVSKDKNYLTAREAAKVTGIATHLYNKTSITDFSEFRYFETLTRIETSGLRGMTNCATIVLPDSLTHLQHYACSSSGFTEFSSEFITTFGTNTFASCTKLQKVYLPNATDWSYNQWSSAFSGCTVLDDVTLGLQPTVTGLNGLFASCKALTASSFKRPITFIGNVTSCLEMFASCTALTSLPPITIQNMVGTIASMFTGCTGLVGTIDLRDIFGESCNATACNSLFNNCANITKLILPELPNCTTLAAFFQTDGTNTTIEEIGDIYAPLCTNIDRWLVNNSTKSGLKKVGNLTLGAVGGTAHEVTSGFFKSCPNLEEIGDVDLSSATSVNELFNGCSKLVTIGSLSISAQCYNFWGIFRGCSSLDNWNAILSDCDFSNATDTAYAFYNCTNLTSWNSTLSGLNLVGEYCFRGSGLSGAVTLGCYYIGPYAFQNLTGITSITFPSRLNKIKGNSVFAGCTGLTTIDLSNTQVTYLKGYNRSLSMFYGCSNVTSVKTPTTLKVLGGVFSYMTGLQRVNSTTDGVAFLHSIEDISRIELTDGTGFTLVFGGGTNKIKYVFLPNLIRYGINVYDDNGNISSNSNTTYYGSLGNTNISIVDIGSDVTSFCKGAFSKMKPDYFIIRATGAVPTLAGALSGTTSQCKFFVPSSMVNAYKSATNWSTYASQFYEIGGTEWTTAFNSSSEFADVRKYALDDYSDIVAAYNS